MKQQQIVLKTIFMTHFNQYLFVYTSYIIQIYFALFFTKYIVFFPDLNGQLTIGFSKLVAGDLTSVLT